MRADLARPLHCSTEAQPAIASSSDTGSGSATQPEKEKGDPSRWMWRVAGDQEQPGGAGVADLAEDGSQRVHGARTDPLSLSGTHVSLT